MRRTQPKADQEPPEAEKRVHRVDSACHDACEYARIEHVSDITMHRERCPACFPDGEIPAGLDQLVVGKADHPTACNYSLGNPFLVEPDDWKVQDRDTCPVCFPEGTIPDDTAVVLVGDCCTVAHRHANEAEKADLSQCKPDTLTPGSEGLAAKLEADEFGPEDLSLGESD